MVCEPWDVVSVVRNRSVSEGCTDCLFDSGAVDFDEGAEETNWVSEVGWNQFPAAGVESFDEHDVVGWGNDALIRSVCGFAIMCL